MVHDAHLPGTDGADGDAGGRIRAHDRRVDDIPPGLWDLWAGQPEDVQGLLEPESRAQRPDKGEEHLPAVEVQPFRL